MSLPEALRRHVRERAGFACEYCGVTEADQGGELTIDHYRPIAREGTDGPENLLYCCVRCNQYKADYWPEEPDEPSLWNPRVESASTHLLPLADGTLYPLTAPGNFTLRRLRLNRPPLVAFRRERLLRSEERRLLEQYQAVITLLNSLSEQQAALLDEQHRLLEQQQTLLRLLLDKQP